MNFDTSKITETITGMATNLITKGKASIPMLKDFAKEKAPLMMIVGNVGGAVLTAGLAVDATVKACKAVEERKKAEEKDKLDPFVVLQTSWKFYIPAIAALAFTETCGIMGYRNSIKTNLAAAATISWLEDKYAKQQEAMESELTKGKVDRVNNVVAQSYVDDAVNDGRIPIVVDSDNPDEWRVDEDMIHCSGNGNTLILDEYTGQLFRGNVDDILTAENRLIEDVNEDCQDWSLNDWLYEIGGLANTSVGNENGWSQEVNGKLTRIIRMESTLINGRVPCAVISYVVPPMCGFDYH